MSASFNSTIPFSGFYCSVHDAEFDNEIERSLENVPASDTLTNLAYDAADFGSARLEYAKAYAAAFLEWLGLDGKFESLISPRGYNFETDRIFVDLTPEDIERLQEMVPAEAFRAVCRERFTSRSGFISFYSPDPEDWGPIEDWDHNQIGTLVECAARIEDPDLDEIGLMENFLCNGGVHNAMWDGPQADRFWRIINFLERRAA